MRLIALILAIVCLAGAAPATDMALNIKLNGREIHEGDKSSKIILNGILLVEDINTDTNVYNGSLIILDTKPAHWEWSDKPTYIWPWGWFWLKYVRYYEDANDVDVRILRSRNQEFGMLVDTGDSAFAGIGRLIMNKNNVQQVIISEGHGAFLYAGFYEDPVVTNTVEAAEADFDDGEMVELEVGKMSARLNKTLTDKINDSDDDDVTIDEWLKENNFRLYNRDQSE